MPHLSPRPAPGATTPASCPYGGSTTYPSAGGNVRDKVSTPITTLRAAIRLPWASDQMQRAPYPFHRGGGSNRGTKEPGAAGSRGRATVLRCEQVGGRRISILLRPDGTTFTVTVPAGGMDACEVAGDTGPGAAWIIDDGAEREPSAASLHQLALSVASC